MLDDEIYIKVCTLFSRCLQQDFTYKRVAQYHICYSADYMFRFELNSLNSEQKTDESVLLKLESSIKKSPPLPSREYLYNGIGFDLIDN